MLEIYYGAAGTGKTAAQIELIRKNAENGIHTLAVIPNQFTFAYEKQLYDALGIKLFNSGYVTVLSPERIVFDIFQKNTSPALSAADDNVKTSLLYSAVRDICEDKTEGLSYYGRKGIDVMAFSATCMTMITELSHSGITPAILFDIADKAASEGRTFSAKLFDIARIYDRYISKMESYKMRDTSHDMMLAADIADDSDYFNGLCIYIDEFKSFTGDQYRLIRSMIKAASCVTVNMTSADLNDRNVFHSVNKTITDLARICSEETGVQPQYKRFNTPMRYSSSGLAVLSSELPRIVVKPSEASPDGISIVTAPDINTECAYICSEIRRLFDQGYEPKDITILSRNMNSDISVLSEYFDMYDIPYYSDKKTDASHMPLIAMINAILVLSSGKYSTDIILTLARTGLVISADEAVALENYVYTWDIEGKMWTKPFPDEDMEELRTKLLYPVELFSSAESIIDGIKNIIDKTDLRNKLPYDRDGLNEAELSELENTNKWLFDQIDGILASLSDISEEIKSTSEFADIFTMISNKTAVSPPPASLNQVNAQQSDLARPSMPKVVFVMNAVDGIFPYVPTDSKTFSETERDFFREKSHDLSGDMRLRISEERFNAYKALCASSEKLYISYSKANNASPSVYIQKTEKIFPDVTKTDLCASADDLFNILALTPEAAYAHAAQLKLSDDMYYTARTVLSSDDEYSHRFSLLDTAIDSANSEHRLSNGIPELLFGKKLKISPTSAEKYAKCPFRFFVENGLRLNKPQKKKLNELEWGKIVHKCMERFTKPHKGETPEQCKARISHMNRDEISAAIDRYIDDYIHEQFREEFKATDMDIYLSRLRTQTVTFACRLRNEMAVSEFVPVMFEKDISHNSTEHISFIGKVDRIDTFTHEGHKYIRVIDYKTGQKQLDVNDIANGLNIQMLLYLFEAVSDEMIGGEYAGVLYARIKHPGAVDERDPSDEQLQKKLKDDLRMDGLILDDKKIIQAMEPALIDALEKSTAYKGEFIPVDVNSTKSGATIKGKIKDKAHFEELKDMIYAQLSEMSENVYNGIIPASPLEAEGMTTTCEQCDIRDICLNTDPVSRKRVKFRSKLDDPTGE